MTTERPDRGARAGTLSLPEIREMRQTVQDATATMRVMAAELERLRRIEAAAWKAVDAAGSHNWPVNCDRLRMALAGAQPEGSARDGG